MKKRILLFVAQVTILVMLMAVSVSAAGAPRSGECGPTSSWSFSAGTLTISGTGTPYNGWIGYVEKDEVEKVVFEEGITGITRWLLKGYHNLEKVIIPASATNIEMEIYEDCPKLTSAGPIGSGACIEYGWTTEIPTFAFSGMTSLTSVTFPETMVTIGQQSFFKTSVTSVVLPDSVRTIKLNAFANIATLTNLRLGEGLTVIEGGAFRGSGLTEIIIPASVTTIQAATFNESASLSHFVLPATVTSFGNYNFDKCTLLKTAGPIGSGCNIEYGYTDKLPQNLLAYEQITSVIIPEGITEIGQGCFDGCKNLSSVTFPSSLTTIGARAFANCAKLQLEIGDNLPNLKTIGDSAFTGCPGLSKVKLGPDTTSGFKAFEGCTQLKTAGPVGSGCDYEFSWTTAIPQNAFSGCSSLTAVTIPSTVTAMGDESFRDCAGLTKIDLPTAITVYPIDAFAGCTGLKEFTIPNTVVDIGMGAFYGCTGLTKMVIPDSVTTIQKHAFNQCSNLETIRISENTKTIEYFVLENCPKVTILGFPDSVAKTYAAEKNIPFKTLARVQFVTGRSKVNGEEYREFIIGEKYGPLPTVETNRVDIYTFAGWYAYLGNGELHITEDTICDLPPVNCVFNGRWVKDDIPDGLVKSEDGKLIYYENGEPATQKYGFAQVEGVKLLIVNGKYEDSINGLYNDPEHPEDWYFLAEGRAQTQHTGLVTYDGAWFYVSQGKMDSTVGGYVSYDGGLFFVGVGRIMTEVNGLAQDPKNPTDWYYLANGQAQTQYTGLAQYDGAWFYVVNGKLASDYTGTVSYDGSQFKVVNGMLQK